MFFASVFNFIPAILQKKNTKREGRCQPMHLPLSLHSSWPPCNILSISLCNAQLRNLLHQREEKTPPASLFSQRARWNFSGVTPADYSRVVFYTHTHTYTHTFFLFLSLFPLCTFPFSIIIANRAFASRREAAAGSRAYAKYAGTMLFQK